MNFLYNMFGGRSSKHESSKYDRITFKINLSEYIPQYYESWSNKVPQETQMTPDDPLYYELFPKKQENYLEYIVKPDDTFIGLAIKLDLNQKHLRNINDISGNLYPGMKIKLPLDADISKLEEQYKIQMKSRPRISQLLSTDKLNNVNHKYTVNYFTGKNGYIKGILTVNNNYIIFNPLLEDPDNLQNMTVEKLLKFNVLVEMTDIQKAEYLELDQIEENFVQNHTKKREIVQFLLYKVGNKRVQKKYKERLRELKLKHTAIAAINFFFLDLEDPLKVCTQLTDNINKAIQQIEALGMDYEEEQKKCLTNVPYYDIIGSNNTNSQKQLSEPQHKIFGKSAIFGTITDQSDIITTEHFDNLISGFPMLYKLYNWTKVYSARRDGSAFNTFLNKSKNIQPAILLIKQYKGNILGAFLIESIEAGKTGRGEMFIFNFEGESKQANIYEWKGGNEFFVYLQKDQGIGIGMGKGYGIFLDRNLQKGSSASTITFGNNEKLSRKEDFSVDEVEIWGVDSSY